MKSHDGLNVSHEIVESDECELALQMGIFAKMAASVTVFRTETLLDAEYIPKRRKARLEIELGALRQKCRLAIII
jgi:hypothetical protein